MKIVKESIGVFQPKTIDDFEDKHKEVYKAIKFLEKNGISIGEYSKNRSLSTSTPSPTIMYDDDDNEFIRFNIKALDATKYKLGHLDTLGPIDEIDIDYMEGEGWNINRTLWDGSQKDIIFNANWEEAWVKLEKLLKK